jgi:hypothetical protein
VASTLTPAACPCRGDGGALDAVMLAAVLPAVVVGVSAVVVVGRDEAMSAMGLRCLHYAGGLNRSTQHFILEGKDGVWDGAEIS